MASSGQLPSDQTLVVMSLQVFLHFRPVTTSGTSVSVGPFTAAQGMTVTPTDAQGGIWRMYYMCQEQLFWTFAVAEKPQFQHPTFYTPAGGGIHGFASDTTLYVLNNGTPDKQAILKLAKPIVIPPRQGFAVNVDILTPPTPSGVTADASDNLLTQLNSAGRFARDVKYVLDGINTRDVL